MEEMDFFWDPEKKEIGEAMIEKYDSSIGMWVQYIWEGGFRDLGEFLMGYVSSFDYQKSKGWLTEDANPETHKEEVKIKMAKTALEEKLEFIYCPFMKTRALEVIEQDIAPSEIVEDVLCNLTQGINVNDFSMTDKHRQERKDYLTDVGIFN